MHTTRRPVPSKAALKALRKLAYVASGTACGAAAIVYEERRRRIHFFKQVAENGRIIRSFADKRRNHATAAAVLQDYDSFDAVQHGGWSVQDPHPTHARRRRSRSRALDELENSEGTWLEGAHDEYLPSQVERGYDQISSTKTPNVLRRDDEGGRRRQGDKPSANASDFSRQRQRHDHSRYKRVRVGHQQQGVETGHYNSRNPPQRQVETSLDRVGKAIELWSGRFAQLSGPNPDMTKSWRTVLTAVAENDGAQVEDLIREATSARALVMVALRLHLPDLLLQICRYTCEHDTTPVVAYQITSRLLATRQTSLTASTRDFLLEWLESGATGLSTEESSWLKIQLLASGRTGSSRQALAVEFKSVQGHSFYYARLKTCLSTLISAQRFTRASEVYLFCTELLDQKSTLLADLATWLCKQFLSQNHFLICRRFVSDVEERSVNTDGLLDRLWKESTEPSDLIAMFQTFGLQGLNDGEILEQLCSTLILDTNAATAVSELYSSRARLWAGTIAQSWTARRDIRESLKSFWRLQDLVGERPLHPVVYDAILRITKEADLSLEHSLIEKHWKRLVISTSNTTTITKVVQAAQNNQWDTVKAQIPELKIEGFVTMQTQQRMHTFDPVFEAFGTPNCDVKELWSLAVTLCNQLSSTPSPDQVLALVSASLIRSGKIEALSRLRAWSSNALDRPLRLTPIDAFDHLRSYYYSFRPSTAVLADLMHKLFKDAWSMVSRLCIPLLDISAAYETKWNQQKRVAAQNQDLVRNALMQIDDPAFREQTTQQITARDSETIEELSMTVDEFTIRKKSGPLVFEIMSVRGSRAPDAENKSQPTAPSTESPQSHHCSDRSDSVKDKRSKPLHKINPVVETETTATETHVIRPPAQGASSAYFSHSKTKALMHDSNSRGDHQSTVDLLEAFSSSNLYTPGPTLASLGMDSAASLSPDLTNAIKQQAELAGGDTSLARLTQLISSLSSSEVDKSKLGSETLLSELKDIVSSEYERLSDHGHLVNHSVATAVANLLLSADQPTAAIELLRHALKLPQTAHASPGSAPMLSLLKAYIQLGRIDGVRWVAGHMFAHNERIEKSFITALKAGQGYWSRKKGLPRTARQKLVSELELVQRLCLAKKEEQIRASWDVGNQLVKYITDNSQKLPMEDSKPLGEQSKEWVDAVIVESVCRDIMIYAQRNKYGSKVPREVDHPEHLRIKGVMERLEQRRSEVEAAA